MPPIDFITLLAISCCSASLRLPDCILARSPASRPMLPRRPIIVDCASLRASASVMPAACFTLTPWVCAFMMSDGMPVPLDASRISLILLLASSHASRKSET